jgi:hypothetical protein
MRYAPAPAPCIDVDTLALHQAREVREQEPVDTSRVNGRAPEEWEKAEIKAARERQRHLEWRP